MNYYQAPNSELISENVDENRQAAPLLRRLFAGIVDLGIIFLFIIFFVYFAGQTFSSHDLSVISFEPKVTAKSMLTGIWFLTYIGGFIAYVLMNSYWLSRFGQTVGKK